MVAKILEKIVATQLSTYLEQNKLLHPHQGAYRCGKSTEDILQLAVYFLFIINFTTELGTGGCTQKAQPVQGANPKPREPKKQILMT